MTADRVNYITATATWDPCYCQAVCPWSVTTSCADVKSDRWYPCSHACPPRPHKWRGSPCSSVGTWSTPRHTPWWSAAVHGSDGPQSNYIDGRSQLVRTAVSDSIDRVPNESREIYFPPGKFISRELTSLELTACAAVVSWAGDHSRVERPTSDVCSQVPSSWRLSLRPSAWSDNRSGAKGHSLCRCTWRYLVLWWNMHVIDNIWFSVSINSINSLTTWCGGGVA